jgi:hypothetical protein
MMNFGVLKDYAHTTLQKALSPKNQYSLTGVLKMSSDKTV